MQRLNRIKVSLFCGLVILNLCAFRTPAKMYAGAFTVKLQLKKNFTEYDVPMWIKPDQAESSIDPLLLSELGYSDKELVFDEVLISGFKLEQKKFKRAKSEWAFVPDFAKSCCHGVIGRDILQKFEIRFDPKAPPHLEWKPLAASSEAPVYSSAFLNSLKPLFSLEKTINVPYLLNLREGRLHFEEKITAPQPTLFSFFFIPPERLLRVTSIAIKDVSAAKKVGFTSGMIIQAINGEDISGLDRWVIEKYLRGEKSSTIKLLTKNKKEFTFDFVTRQFK